VPLSIAGREGERLKGVLLQRMYDCDVTVTWLDRFADFYNELWGSTDVT
jgi:hypothetical protein